ncbi:MAG: YdcF family protein [Rhodospirillales bacterium]|nr:YdcF family protein [Rhodospirillales bacterium]
MLPHRSPSAPGFARCHEGPPVVKRRLAWLAALPVAAFALGFAWFVLAAAAAPDARVRADGIVVLTGGSDRVRTGLRLLAEKRAPLLLISGVARGADYPTLARLDGARPGLSGRVTLGHRAHTTAGNARETAAWAAARHMTSLIVVTAFYHMPRALAEMSRTMPRIRLYAYPVHPPFLHPWWHAWAAWRLLGQEYVKYLAVASGIAPLLRLD